MQSLPNTQQQEIAANTSPNRSGGRTFTTPQDKTQSKMERNLLAQSRENISSDNGGSYDIKSITIPEMLSKTESGMDKVLSSHHKEKFGILSRELGLQKQKLQEIAYDIYVLQYHRDQEYAGGVVSIRNQLAHMFLSSTQNAQRKQQLANPIDVRAYVDNQDELAYDVNLMTTINKADLHPAYFDICVDTVFGAPKNLIKRLLKWDKTRECQVYCIFSDHGEAWHKGFANTCPKPFKTWLSSIICLEKYESAISDNPSPDFEILIQDQKEQVKKAIQEWNETYTNDKWNYGNTLAECQKIIEEDYRERGLIPRIKENLFHGVKLDQ